MQVCIMCMCVCEFVFTCIMYMFTYADGRHMCADGVDRNLGNILVTWEELADYKVTRSTVTGGDSLDCEWCTVMCTVFTKFYTVQAAIRL